MMTYNDNNGHNNDKKKEEQKNHAYGFAFIVDIITMNIISSIHMVCLLFCLAIVPFF